MTLEDLKTRRANLQAAYDALIAGEKAQSVAYQGRSVTYAAGDADRLKRAIAELDGKIARLEGGLSPNRPVRPFF